MPEGGFLGYKNRLNLAFHDRGSAVERHVDIGTDVVFSQQMVETIVFEHGMHVGRDTRKHDVGAFAVAHLAEVLQVVDTRRVDKRHAAHTDDAPSDGCPWRS